MTAILSKLASYEELQNSTQYGYYRGGFFRLAKTEPTPSPQKPIPPSCPPPISTWLEATFPSTLGSDQWLSPKIEIKTRFKFDSEEQDYEAGTQPLRASQPLRNRTANARCKECPKLDERRSLLSTKAKSNFAPYPMHAPKVFGFTGPLLSTRPKTAAVRAASRRARSKEARTVFRRVSPGPALKNPESVTCIEVLIPTPKFRRTPAVFSSEETEDDIGKHHKALSMGDNPLIENWAEKFEDQSREKHGVLGASFSKPGKHGEEPLGESLGFSLYTNHH